MIQQAVRIIDSLTKGNPDLGARAWRLFKDFRCDPSAAVSLASREKQVNSAIKTSEDLECKHLFPQDRAVIIYYENGNKEVGCDYIDSLTCFCEKQGNQKCHYQEKPLGIMI